MKKLDAIGYVRYNGDINGKIVDFVNKFDEMMNNISLTNDEIKELKLAEQSDAASEQNPFRGRRQKVSKVKVVCVSCNREYEMYPSQIHNRERWTCNRCIRAIWPRRIKT